MRILLVLFTFMLYGCSTSKSVLICGDHECINKEEARLFFEENLTIEVKVITKNKEKNFNLVKMNLEKEGNNIKIFKSKNKKIVRKLSKDEIKLKKSEIKEKNKSKKVFANKNEKEIETVSSIKIEKSMTNKNPLNICSILEKCNIDTISDYLIKQSLSRDYPNIASKN